MKSPRQFLAAVSTLLLLSFATALANGARGKRLVGAAEISEKDIKLSFRVSADGTQYETEKVASKYYLLQIKVQNYGKDAFAFTKEDQTRLVSGGKETDAILDLNSSDSAAWEKLNAGQKSSLQFPVTVEPGKHANLNIFVPDSSPLKDHPPEDITLHLKSLSSPVKLKVEMRAIATKK